MDFIINSDQKSQRSSWLRIRVAIWKSKLKSIRIELNVVTVIISCSCYCYCYCTSSQGKSSYQSICRKQIRIGASLAIID